MSRTGELLWWLACAAVGLLLCAWALGLLDDCRGDGGKGRDLESAFPWIAPGEMHIVRSEHPRQATEVCRTFAIVRRPHLRERYQRPDGCSALGLSGSREYTGDSDFAHTYLEGHRAAFSVRTLDFFTERKFRRAQC